MPTTDPNDLTSERVSAIIVDCLYRAAEAPVDGPIPTDAVIVEGVVRKFGFHPQRLESHRADVIALLRQLPPEFDKVPHGGWSFLNACVRRDGEQWGEHSNIEELLALGLGLKLVEWSAPRRMWPMLPGGMPYVALTLPEPSL